MLLIIGANGLLGKYAVEHFESRGIPVFRMSHRQPADRLFDLSQPVEQFSFPAAVSHALFCSSMTSIDACCLEPERTEMFNVTRTVEFLQQLLRRDIIPIFCSSDLVFDGSRGGYRETDDRLPNTAYGRQKKSVEDFLSTQNKPFLIVRMTKIYSIGSDDTSPIKQMLDALASGRAVRCAVDQAIVPTWVGDVVKCIELLLKLGKTGIYHLASQVCYTRFTLGRLLSGAVGRGDLLAPCSIGDFPFAEPRPKDNSLNADKVAAEIGINFVKLEDILPEVLRCHGYAKNAEAVSDYVI